MTIHSDQGCQYTSYEYHKFLDENAIVPSMSRLGTPIDNAPMESFFSTIKIKVEWLPNTSKTTINHVNKEIMEYITFYNNVRLNRIRVCHHWKNANWLLNIKIINNNEPADVSIGKGSAHTPKYPDMRR